MGRRSRWVTIGAVVVSLVATSCGGGPSNEESVATESATRIEDELAPDIGLGALAAECEQPGGTEPATTFSCTATTEDDQVIEFTAEIADEGAVDVRSTNLISADGLAALEKEAAAVLTEQSGTRLPPGALQCPDTPSLVVEVGTVVRCELDNPRTGATDPARITINGVDPLEFEVELG